MPAELIARIAAGEVVERPASVVKELMENSLDAGASSVEVNLASGGKTLIQVKDNGGGIARADMERLFVRHATSKIASADDLDHIMSLGFRGEALYSVSSVSELTMKSRLAGAMDAWEINVRGGVRQAVAPAAMPSQGTDIRVEELFLNTPARKKFLKSDTSELDQAVHVFLPYALLFPEKKFTLTHNNRTVYDLPAAADGAERAARALALDARHIVALDEGGRDGLRVRGWLGDINIQRARRDLQYIFVNGRPVQAKGLLFHMNDVYRLVMPEGAHPFFILSVDIPPSDVDVNIHPAKREVRIKDEAVLGSLIRRSVEQALMTKGSAKEVRAEIFTFEPGVMPGDERREPSNPGGVPSGKIVFGPGQRSSVPSFEPRSERPAMARPGSDLFEAPAALVKENDFAAFTGAIAERRDDQLRDRLSRARLIGTFASKYHLFEEGGSLFAVDQHAAQERILFEVFAGQMTAGTMDVERLLVPMVVRLSPRELLAWEVIKPELDTLGFESTLMGEGAVALQSYPRLITAPEAAFRALLSDEVKSFTGKDLLARRACRASVMAGERMHGDEAREQLKRLLACADPFTCPHGRPVFIELKESFLDRQFLRI